jgi:hypothetical protein
MDLKVENQIPRTAWSSFVSVSALAVLTVSSVGVLGTVALGDLRFGLIWIGVVSLLVGILRYGYVWMRKAWPEALTVTSQNIVLVYPGGRQKVVEWDNIAELDLRPRRRHHEAYVNIWYKDGRRENGAEIFGLAAYKLVEAARAQHPNILVSSGG